MPTGSGWASRCGIGKETAWGTLVAPTELLPYVTSDIKETAARAPGEMLVGKAGKQDIADVVAFNAAGTLEMYADYQLTDLIWALAMGSPAAVSGGSAPYTHAITLIEDFVRAASLHIDKGVEDFYLHGTRVNELTWHSDPDNVGMTCGVVGQKITRGTTHHSALVALSAALGTRVFHDQGVLRIADCTDALQGSDAIAVSNISFTLSNTLSVDVRTTTSGLYPSEFIRGGQRGLTLSFTLPRFASNAFFGYMDSETKLQADLIYSGPTLGAGKYTLTFQFPTLKVTSCAADIGGPGLINNVVECECYCNNGNTNMSGVTEQMALTILNNRGTSIWALS